MGVLHGDAAPLSGDACVALSASVIVLDSSGEEEGSRERSWRAIDIDACPPSTLLGCLWCWHQPEDPIASEWLVRKNAVKVHCNNEALLFVSTNCTKLPASSSYIFLLGRPFVSRINSQSVTCHGSSFSSGITRSGPVSTRSKSLYIGIRLPWRACVVRASTRRHTSF